jgi:hypothetical protein
MRREGVTFEVTSVDELDRAVSVGIPPSRIVVHRDDGSAAPIRHDRDLRKFNGITVRDPYAIACLPGATGNCHRRAQPSGAELDGNRRVGMMGERTQRRRAIRA